MPSGWPPIWAKTSIRSYRRQEADNVAVARAGIEIVLAVEDHVLGRLDPAEPDSVDVAQPVVQRERRLPLSVVGGGGRVIGRADIDLADDAVAVLHPADVDHRREQQDARQHHAVDAAGRGERGEAVGDQQHDQRADQRLGHRSLAAAEADAAEDAAVSTVTSRPAPISPPTVPSRAAKKSAPTAVSMPEMT